MSSVVETSLIIIVRRRARDSSTPLRCARNDTMEGYLSINETFHSRPNRAAILRGYPAWIRTKNNASKGRCVTVTPRGKSAGRFTIFDGTAEVATGAAKQLTRADKISSPLNTPKDAKIHRRKKAFRLSRASSYQEKFMVTCAGKNCRAVILTANKKNGGENRRPTIGLLGRLRLPRCYSLGFGRRMSTVLPLP